ncbi:MAG: response regulator [Deltaproteobacteria bacterium]|nr:response regulator [Deltaproteobacteria bacterium]
MEPKRVFLLPSEYIVSKQPHRVSTLLGSCVSVCLYNRQANFGGMNHFMLPESPSGVRSAKYGDYSIQTMIQFMKRGAGDSAGRLEAMIFGGASVVGAIRSGSHIGEKNVDLAREVLRHYNILVKKDVTGGSSGMKIEYHTWNNEIHHRPIERSQFAETMLAKEKHFDSNRIKVLVVDDSPLVRTLLVKALQDEPDLEVVGEAGDAFEAREILLERNPDVITLDIIMPKMDGVSFLKKLMAYHPMPVIIVSTIAKAGSKVELRADKIGAVDIIDKEVLKIHNGLEKIKSILIPKIRTASRALVKKKAMEELAAI